MSKLTDKQPAYVRPLVMGIGSKFRGDDEIGLIAVESVESRLGSRDIDFCVQSDDPARIILEWTGRSEVIVVDAVRMDSTPGTIHRVDVNKSTVAPRSRTSSHGNALGDAIELARKLDALPQTTIVIGLEPENTTLGSSLSESCKNSLAELDEKIVEELRCMNLR